MKSSLVVVRSVLLLLALLPCYFVSYGSISRDSIYGYLEDRHGSPIPFATLVLSRDSLSREIMAHTLSDSRGVFAFKNVSLSFDLAWITVRSIGYHKCLVPIGMEKITDLHIQMEEDITGLPEVLVEGIAPDMYIKGDTVVYRSQNYRIGHENSMGDVVSRMPGVEINPSGLVYFQGRPISTLLINGADVLTSSIASNLETFTSDFADEVEVITDYNDGSIDRGMRSDQKVALNLKTKRSLHANGWLDIAGGMKKKYNGRVSLISLIDKVSITGKFNTNNIGDRWILWGDYNNLTSDSHRFGGQATNTIIYNSDEEEMLIPHANMYERKGGAGVLSFIWMPNQKYRVEFNNTLHQSRSQKQSLSNQLFMKDIANSIDNRQTLEEARNLVFGAHEIEQRWIPTKYFSVENRTRIEYTSGGAQEYSENLLLNNAENPLVFRDVHTRAYTSIANEIEIKGVQGRTLFFLGNKSYWYRSNKHSNWDSNDAAMVGLVRSEVPYPYMMSYRLSTIESSQRTIVQCYLGAATPVFIDHILRTELRFNQARRIRGLQQGSITNLEDSNISKRLSAYLSLMKSQGPLIYNLSVDGGWLSLDYVIGVQSLHKCLPFLAPRIELGFRPSNLHRVLVSSSYESFDYDLTDLSLMEYRNSYLEKRKASKIGIPFYKVWDSSIDYSYSHLRNKLFLNAIVSYRARFNEAMRDLVQDGIRYTFSISDGGKSNEWDARCNGSYSLPKIPIDLQISIGYSSNTRRFMYNQHPDLLKSDEFSTSTTVQTRFRSSPINALMQLSLSQVSQEYKQRNPGQQHSLVIVKGQLYGHFKKLSMSLSGGSQWLNAPQQTWNILDFGFTLRYSVKKFVLELRGKDIRHIHQNDWVVRDVNMEYISTTLYRQMPGHIMLSVRYTI